MRQTLRKRPIIARARAIALDVLEDKNPVALRLQSLLIGLAAGYFFSCVIRAWLSGAFTP